MTSHTHIDSGKTAPSRYRDGAIERVTLCGEQGDILGQIATVERATCSKCSAEYWGPRIPAGVTIERWDEKAETGRTYTTYRSVYILKVDGVHRAYICCEHGWGAGWTVRECDNHYRSGDQRPSDSAPPPEGVRQLISREQAIVAAAAKIAAVDAAGDKRKFQPAMSVEEWKRAEAEHAARNAALKEQRRLERIAESGDRLTDINAELVIAEARLQALHGINVEAPASAAAIAWAVQATEKEISNIRNAITNTTNYRARLESGKDD